MRAVLIVSSKPLFLFAAIPEVLPHRPLDQPTLSEIIAIHHRSASQFHPLPAEVDPCEIDVKRRLHDAEDDLDGRSLTIPTQASCLDRAHEPVQNVEESVGAQRCEVEGVDNGGYGGLAEEKELWQDAGCFEDEGENPDRLC